MTDSSSNDKACAEYVNAAYFKETGKKLPPPWPSLIDPLCAVFGRSPIVAFSWIQSAMIFSNLLSKARDALGRDLTDDEQRMILSLDGNGKNHHEIIDALKTSSSPKSKAKTIADQTKS